MDFKIRRIMPQDYGNIRMLDREACGRTGLHRLYGMWESQCLPEKNGI